MSNRGLEGKVLDENGHPLKGLVVQVEGAGKIESSLKGSRVVKALDKISPVSLKDQQVLAESETDSQGYYKLLYSPDSYQNILDDKPTIQVVVKDSLGISELKRTDKHIAVSETMKTMEDIIIPRNWAEGWYVTLGGSRKSRFTTDNQVEVLVDNQLELERVVESMEKAQSYIYLTQFEFETDFIATFTREGDNFRPQSVLTRTLKEAGERGVDVKIILNENLTVPDSYSQMEEFFQDSSVEIREFKSHGLHVMHAKTMVVDGKEAYVIGSPFKKDYWDSPHHIIKDPRRKPQDVRPVHDVSIKLKGGAVYHVEEFFCQMWNYIAQEEYQGQGKIEPPIRNPVSTTVGKTPVQIVRSVTPKTLRENGELGIFEGYRRALAQAKQFIYLENQFLTNKSIIKALKSLMDRNHDLEVIVVMNENPDNPGYKRWQNQCLEKVGMKTFQDILDHPQIGFFTLWSTRLEKENFTIQPVYVHTKVAVVDDVWATGGTANLDGSSLTHVNELEGFFDMEFHRNMEMNVILPGVDARDEIVKLRDSLWREHLGIKEQDLEKPRKGWLKLWQEIAEQNLKSLKQSHPYMTGQILPYSSEESVEGQLNDLGIKTSAWEVLD